ncbi:hypothetical protein AVEN_71912-1 [Araneus ventricosus]|uniref:Uncharacterized protein n=1 Tax=Araneus ventricosus TaxID=182803 RepID=A0A4Y2MQC6_ARAVE|nr:hypothetical protein AVEN_71912-1 [Araneus ventricosus]
MPHTTCNVAIPPGPIMPPHRGGGDVRLEFFLLAGSPKAYRPFHYTQLKHKGNGQGQTSSLGRPRSSEAALSSFTMNRSLIVLDTVSSFSVRERTLGLGLAED